MPKSSNDPYVHQLMNGLKNIVYPYNTMLFSHQKEWSADTWYNLDKNFMLSEWSQSQKTIYCMIPFTWNVQNKQIFKVFRDSRLMVASSCRRVWMGSDEWGMTAQVREVYFWSDENVLSVDCGDNSATLNILKCTLNG